MKKLLRSASALLCALLFCFCMAPEAVRADSPDTVDIEVQYGQTEARAMLQMINAFRTSPTEAWAWNAKNEKVSYNNLSELQYDYELEKIAMLRAAETALSFSHTRPNGTLCFTAYAGYPCSGMAENIAMGQRTSEAVFKAWQETNYPYSGQGHRRNMLSGSLNTIGIGHVIYNGKHYWVQEFGKVSSPSTAVTPANDGQQTVTVEVTSADRYPNLPSNGNGSNKDNSSNRNDGSNADNNPNKNDGSNGDNNATAQKEYTVTFDAGYGSMEVSKSQSTVNQKLSSLPTASRAGYTFNGWYTQPEGGEMVTTATVFSRDATVYAHWKALVQDFDRFSAEPMDTTALLTISIPTCYVDTWGISVGTSSYDLSESQDMGCYKTTGTLQIMLLDLEPDTVYYYRVYYITDASKIKSDVMSFRTEKTPEYTVMFHANGGNVNGQSYLTTTDKKIPVLPDASREGYTFDGWYTAPDGGSRISSSTVFDADSTVYAHWTRITSQEPTAPSTPLAPTTPSDPVIDTGNNGNDPGASVSVKKVQVKSAKNSGKGKIKVKWNFSVANKGYQVACSTRRDFSSGSTKIVNAGALSSSKTVSGLKRGRTYYVKVRAYKNVNSQKYYGGWSNVTKVFISK